MTIIDELTQGNGMPLAAGWFLAFLSLGVWAAKHGYEIESVSLSLLGFGLVTIAVIGSLLLLIRLNFYASASFFVMLPHGVGIGA